MLISMQQPSASCSHNSPAREKYLTEFLFKKQNVSFITDTETKCTNNKIDYQISRTTHMKITHYKPQVTAVTLVL